MPEPRVIPGLSMESSYGLSFFSYFAGFGFQKEGSAWMYSSVT
jgi:hypothetical protein